MIKSSVELSRWIWFDRSPTKVFEHGDLWVQRVRRLKERNHLPHEMIFPVRMPTEGNVADAAQRVLADLQEVAEVRCVPFDVGNQQLRESLDVSQVPS